MEKIAFESLKNSFTLLEAFIINTPFVLLIHATRFYSHFIITFIYITKNTIIYVLYTYW